MKLTIISTTINGEKGYLPFDTLAAKSPFDKIDFVISGDTISEPFDTSRFQCPVEYLDVHDQGRFKCSESIGWKKIMRRNTALLRAIEMEPDFILMIDDDNIPEDRYFIDWHNTLCSPVARVLEKNKEEKSWYNYLKWSNAPIEIYPRGFPINFRNGSEFNIKKLTAPILNTTIGLYQGVSLGDCDIDAITRIVFPEKVLSLTEKNYCVQGIWSPYNTQNTVFSRILFPLAFVWPFCGRYDDIYSSYTWQQILFNNNMFIHIGDAVNEQERGQRDILKDLHNEVEGYLNAHLVWEATTKIAAKDPISFLEALIVSDHPIIQRQAHFMTDFLSDVQSILEHSSSDFRNDVRVNS